MSDTNPFMEPTREQNPFMEPSRNAPEGQQGVNPNQPMGQQGVEANRPPVGPNELPQSSVKTPEGMNQLDSASKTLNDKLDIFNRGFERMALGGLQLLNRGIRETAGRLPLVGNAIVQDSLALDQQLAASNQRGEQRYNEAYARTPSPLTSLAGSIGGSVVATAPLIAASSPTALGTIGIGAAGGAAAGFMDYSAADKERVTKAALGGAFGGIATGAFLGASSLVRSIGGDKGTSSAIEKMFKPKEAAVKDIAASIKTDAGDDAAAALAKVKDIQAEGTMGRTPGEAIPGTVTRANELSIIANDAEKAQVSKVAQTSQNYVKKQIYDSIDKMAPPEVKGIQKQAFANMEKEFIDTTGKLTDAPPATADAATVPEFIKNNTTLMEKYVDVVKAKSETWKNLPEGSVAKLHKIKDLIDDDLYKAEPNAAGIITKELSPDKKLALEEAKAQIEPILKQSSSYVEAMAATQKLKLKDYYSQLISKKDPKAGQGGELSVDELYQALFKGTGRKQMFLRDVASTGGDPVQAEKMLGLVDSLRQSPLMRVLKRVNSGESVSAVYGKDVGAIQRIVSKLTMNQYRKALLDVTLSGDKWADDVARVLEAPTGVPQTTAFFKLIGEVAGKSAVNAASAGLGKQVERRNSMYGINPQ